MSGGRAPLAPVRWRLTNDEGSVELRYSYPADARARDMYIAQAAMQLEHHTPWGCYIIARWESGELDAARAAWDAVCRERPGAYLALWVYRPPPPGAAAPRLELAELQSALSGLGFGVGETPAVRR